MTVLRSALARGWWLIAAAAASACTDSEPAPVLPEARPLDLAVPAAGGPVLGCPPAPLPTYGDPNEDTGLSPPFQIHCAACHGIRGEGIGEFPVLPGDLDLAGYIDAVRTGPGAMLPFAVEVITDAELTSDFEVLLGTGMGQPVVPMPTVGPDQWTPQQLDEIRARGLALWRTPDERGNACANCHSPDALDLAVIGYADATIKRRALLHVSPQDSLGLRDYIHAQRVWFGLDATCEPREFRPFQPGGAALPAGSVDEAELAFARELEAAGFFVATGEVRSVQDAARAYGELALTDIRRLRWGIEFPRWTEDHINGEEHRTLNDWIPDLAMRGTDELAWYAAQDAYVADPTEAGLFGLLGMIRDGAARLEPTDAHGEMQGLMSDKFGSILVAQHLWRRQLRGQPAWFELGPSVFTSDPPGGNAVWDVGGAENLCGPDPEGCLRLPDEAWQEYVDGVFPQIELAWRQMGILFDNRLGDGSYWFGHIQDSGHLLHGMFLAARRVAVRAQFDGLDTGLPARDDEVPGLLDAAVMSFGALVDNGVVEPAGAGERLDLHRRITTNLHRTMALLMDEELRRGAPLRNRMALRNTVQEFAAYDRAANPGDLALVDDLYDRLLDRIAKATDAG